MPRAEIERLVGRTDGRLTVLCGRVSDQGQRADLETQLARLQSCAKAERPGKPTLVLSDIGSGFKASRKQLQRLLKLVVEDQVDAAQAGTLRLLDISRGVINTVPVTMWPQLDEFGERGEGPAYKQVTAMMGSPDPQEDRQFRCEAEMVGRILRGQAERKKR